VFSALAEHTGGRKPFKQKQACEAFVSATRASLTAAGAAALPKKIALNGGKEINHQDTKTQRSDTGKKAEKLKI
jgi:hypothetical protein